MQLVRLSGWLFLSAMAAEAAYSQTPPRMPAAIPAAERAYSADKAKLDRAYVGGLKEHQAAYMAAVKDLQANLITALNEAKANAARNVDLPLANAIQAKIDALDSPALPGGAIADADQPAVNNKPAPQPAALAGTAAPFVGKPWKWGNGRAVFQNGGKFEYLEPGAAGAADAYWLANDPLFAVVVFNGREVWRVTFAPDYTSLKAQRLIPSGTDVAGAPQQ